MDGGALSQDEINALLNGMDLGGGDSPSGDAGGSDGGSDASAAPAGGGADGDLTDVEKDAIGEVANISMGSSATTLYSLVNRKVNITTPVVELATWATLLTDYERPCVFTQIKYTKGLDGTNIMVLKEKDVK
ncbi:MAG: chemotaxis protein CheC, partial [Lachnospiraceae bacterium]|nr:chemotaxis protein CheC [Lachnospiraceae bacterium]